MSDHRRREVPLVDHIRPAAVPAQMAIPFGLPAHGDPDRPQFVAVSMTETVSSDGRFVTYARVPSGVTATCVETHPLRLRADDVSGIPAGPRGPACTISNATGGHPRPRQSPTTHDHPPGKA